MDDGDFSVNPQFAVESRRIGKVGPEMLFRQWMCVILWVAGPWNQGGRWCPKPGPSVNLWPPGASYSWHSDEPM